MKAKGSRVSHSHAHAVHKEDAIGLDGEEQRTAEDAFFDNLPKKDTAKKQWVHENLEKKTKLANFRQ